MFITFDPIERFLTSLTIFTLFICGILFLSQGRKKEIYHEKLLMYGFTSLWFSFGFVRIFLFLSHYLLEGTYTGDIESIFQTSNLLNILIYYFYEYAYIYLYVNIIFLCLIFVWFSIKLKAEFKAISSLMTIGFTIFLIGWTFEATAIKVLNLILPGISSSLVFIGILIAASPLILHLEFFHRPIANWIVLSLIILIVVFFGLIFFTNLPLSIISLIVIMVSAFVLSLAIIYIIIQVVKRVRAPESLIKAEKRELKDFLQIFTRPSTITKEEINISIEKKMCLVCKSKVSRLNYICPECQVLYCARCSNALSKLENICWVCETPINQEIIREKGGDKDDIHIV